MNNLTKREQQLRMALGCLLVNSQYVYDEEGTLMLIPPKDVMDYAEKVIQEANEAMWGRNYD